MVKKTLKALWKDESAQGSTEYILLLAVVVILAVIFKGRITEMVKGKLDELNSGMGQIKATDGN
jgi:Flp pilus assembly pilin Flp